MFGEDVEESEAAPKDCIEKIGSDTD